MPGERMSPNCHELCSWHLPKPSWPLRDWRPTVSGSREIELKFLCAPRDLSAVLAAAPEGDDDSRELISVYFDTPDLRLQKAGVSLRVRQSKAGRVLTMKRGDGLAREEYEAPLE